jgi:hypothetical protein
MLVLDSVTLRQGAWAQPKQSHSFHVGSNESPELIVGSKNASILSVRGSLLLITPQYSPLIRAPRWTRLDLDTGPSAH